MKKVGDYKTWLFIICKEWIKKFMIWWYWNWKNIESIFISNKVSSGKMVFKCFIGYKDDYKSYVIMYNASKNKRKNKKFWWN